MGFKIMTMILGVLRTLGRMSQIINMTRVSIVMRRGIWMTLRMKRNKALRYKLKNQITSRHIRLVQIKKIIISLVKMYSKWARMMILTNLLKKIYILIGIKIFMAIFTIILYLLWGIRQA